MKKILITTIGIVSTMLFSAVVNATEFGVEEQKTIVTEKEKNTFTNKGKNKKILLKRQMKMFQKRQKKIY